MIILKTNILALYQIRQKPQKTRILLKFLYEIVLNQKIYVSEDFVHEMNFEWTIGQLTT